MKKRRSMPKIDMGQSVRAAFGEAVLGLTLDPAKAALHMYRLTGNVETAMRVFRNHGGMGVAA